MALAAALSVGAQTDGGKLFPYPVVPDDIQRLDERCDYLVSHFWDRCNFKQAFSSMNKLSEAFNDFLPPVPFASADTVHAAIDRLIANVKKSPDQTLKLAKIAERWLYSDSAEFRSEEVYLPFARAVAQNKKINGAERARFEQQVQLIENSGLGAKVKDLPFTTPEGFKSNLGELTAPNILLFINDPTCDDCAMARLRLSADINANRLIEQGVLQIVSIYPDAADNEWLQASASYPANWIVGAMPDADMYFSLRTIPQFYFLDGDHKVIAKDFPIENIFRALAALAK